MTDLQYVKIIRFLECFKIHNGNISLNKTLHNHSQLNQALLEYEKERLSELEREIFNEE